MRPNRYPSASCPPAPAAHAVAIREVKNTIRRSAALLVSVTLLVTVMLSPAASEGAAAKAQVDRWNFDVYLGDKRLGKHVFEVTEEDGQKRVLSEADFEYKILFLSAYSYEHTNRERWANNCLLEFDATTNANGKRIEASGEQTGSGFEVVREDGTAELPACIMSFAYWNPDFLREQRLLNPQSGEYLDVEIEKLPESTVDVRGSKVAATPYKITAKGMQLTVWYSSDNRWLALESLARDDKILRYELS